MEGGAEGPSGRGQRWLWNPRLDRPPRGALSTARLPLLKFRVSNTTRVPETLARGDGSVRPPALPSLLRVRVGVVRHLAAGSESGAAGLCLAGAFRPCSPVCPAENSVTRWDTGRSHRMEGGPSSHETPAARGKLCSLRPLRFRGLYPRGTSRSRSSQWLLLLGPRARRGRKEQGPPVAACPLEQASRNAPGLCHGASAQRQEPRGARASWRRRPRCWPSHCLLFFGKPGPRVWRRVRGSVLSLRPTAGCGRSSFPAGAQLPPSPKCTGTLQEERADATDP